MGEDGFRFFSLKLISFFILREEQEFSTNLFEAAVNYPALRVTINRYSSRRL